MCAEVRVSCHGCIKRGEEAGNECENNVGGGGDRGRNKQELRPVSLITIDGVIITFLASVS
jgi:hypothetical protein